MSNPSPSADLLFSQAVDHHLAGRYPQAEALYRQVLATDPNHPRALHYLGTLATQFGKLDIAIGLIQQALAIAPAYAEAYLDLGNALQSQSKVLEAIDAFRRAAELKPAMASAYVNLGNALQLLGKSDEAVAACRRAIELNPDIPQAYNNLGNALGSLNRSEEAIAAYRRALSLNPQFGLAYFNLANAHHARKETQEAAALYERALSVDPSIPDAYINLGRMYIDTGRLDEAVALLRKGVALKPQGFETHLTLAIALQRRGLLEEAIAEFNRAAAIRPEEAITYNDMANTYKSCQRIPEAIAAYEKYISLKPNDPLGHNNLGTAYADISQHEKAMACYRRALELDPGYLAAVVNLGNAWKDQGRLEECTASFRKAMELDPSSALIHSKLVYTVHFHADYDTAKIGAEARAWNQRHAVPLRSQIQPHRNSRDPARRLKIGYVSPDFWAQAECYFVVPLLEHHDHERFEIHCYASVARPDFVTVRQRKAADVWHDVYGLSDAQVAERIRNDQIDVLVDLTMHMANNRLLAFARKPAPVQVAWLAYPGTTGLEAIDYRITDRFMDPAEIDTSCYPEKPVRLPDCWVCFDPLIQAAPAATRDDGGPIVFASLNNPCKLNAPLLKSWAQVLRQVENSRLLLLTGTQGQRDDLSAFFAAENIDAARLEFTGYHPRPQYLRLYDRIDICLDPLPYNGITTTCDALWMGVPVVTLAGRTAAGRAGLAMLTTAGLPELAAHSEQEFVAIAAKLAKDRARLQELRRTLRQKMESSALMDYRRYARDMENAYREMWRTWCASA